MHHISATSTSQRTMMDFRLRWTFARGADASHLGSLVLPVPFSLFLCSHSSFQALTNGATFLYCRPLCSFSRKSCERSLQFASLVHMASSCRWSLIPCLCPSIFRKTSKLSGSLSSYPGLRHKTVGCCFTIEQCATCLQGMITNANASLNGKLDTDNLTD